jgi:hypothetical protein
MFTFFLGFTAYPIVFDLLALVLIFIFTANEIWPAGILIPTAIMPTVLYFGYGINAFTYILANPFAAIGLVLAYLLVGVLWSIIAWFLYTREKKPVVDLAWEAYKRLSYNKDIPLATLKENFTKSRDNPLYRSGISITDQNNWKIINWAIMWPVSIVWRLIRSFTVDLGKLILSLFGGIYDKIANSVTNSLN